MPLPITLTGTYTAANCDELHAFQSTGGKVIGNMNVIVGNKLKDIYSQGIPPEVTRVDVSVNGMTVNWSVKIDISQNGEAWMGFTSRGAGCGNNIYARATSEQAGNGPIALKNAIVNAGYNPTIDSFKLSPINDFVSSLGDPTMNFKQVFYKYTRPNDYPAIIGNAYPTYLDSNKISPPPPPTTPPISNQDGDLEINLPQNVTNPEEATVVFQKDGYQNVEVNPYNAGGLFIGLPIIEFQDNETALQEIIDESSELSDDQINEVLKDKKTPEWFVQKRIQKTIKTQLKERVMPMILKPIIVAFGVSDPIGLIEKIKKIKEQGQLKETTQQEITRLIQENLGGKSMCPSPDTLIEIIEVKNNVTTQLNQVMNLLNSSTKALGITGGVIAAFEIALQFYKFNPTPLPPGAPIALTSLNEDLKEFADKGIIERLGAITAGTLIILAVLRQTLSKVLQLLELLDNLIQFCSPDTIEFEKELSKELQQILNQQFVDDFNSPINIVNGFTMEIETETTENPVKRRRAIARDSGGIAVLKGEYSFSSNEQILIDELVFYIQTNNLKST